MVAKETTRRSLISWFDMPSTISLITSSSRGDNASGAGLSIPVTAADLSWFSCVPGIPGIGCPAESCAKLATEKLFSLEAFLSLVELPLLLDADGGSSGTDASVGFAE